jgi:PAS domain
MSRETGGILLQFAETVAVATNLPPYGVWTDHRIADDRSDWNPTVRAFYEYWRAAAPPGRLPGRQHIAPEDIVALLPKVWLLDVHRNPLRFRYRLAGTEVVRSLRREVTGQWLDEAHPQLLSSPNTLARYRYIVETGRPTWRRGTAFFDRHPDHHTIENCMVPLAADGVTVDKIFALTVVLDIVGQRVPPL